MKKTTLFLLFCGLLAARADFVYQNGSSFMTTADMDGDGRSDLVLVDGSNASVRVAYQLSAGNFSWSAPRPLGMASVSDIACGNVLDGGHEILVATEPMLNRFNMFHLDSATDPLIPTSIYLFAAGSKYVAAMDIGGAGNTPNDDLFTVSTMNGFNPYYAAWLRSDGTNVSSLGGTVIGAEWSNLNEVEYATGSHALGAMDGMGGFSLTDLSGGGISNIDTVALGVSASAHWVAFIPSGDTFAQFLVWEPGSEFLTTFAIEETSPGVLGFSLPVVYDLVSPIALIQLIQVNGSTSLAVTQKGGVQATLYSYDGTKAPTSFQVMSPPQGEFFVGFSPVANNDMLAFSSVSGGLVGDVTADRQAYSGGQFSSTGSQVLPAAGINQGAANVMTFAGEPFVDSPPQRLQLLRAGDWASKSKISGGLLSASVESDGGVVAGLGNPQSVALGAARPTAVYTLDNQLHPAISAHSFDPARGDELATVMINPSPGTYGTSIEVSLSAQPSGSVYYRTQSSGNWIHYGAPFTLFEDTTVQYLAVVSSGLSVIREASYRFSETPSDLDSDGDGIPDYVELANGLDPLESGLDADGDGYSDLDELLAGSNPLSDASIPSGSNRVERSSVYDFVLTPFAYDGLYNTIHASRVGTQVRLFNATGGQRGFAKTTAASYPPARFEAVPLSFEPPFVTAATDIRFDVTPGTTTNQLGVELVGIYLQPESSAPEVAYAYQGGALATEAANWLSAARSAYTNDVRDVVTDNLGIYDTLSGLLVERKLVDLLYARGTLSTNLVSLFKGRTADKTMAGFTASGLQSLEVIGSGGEAAYHIPTLISYIQQEAVNAPELRELVRDIYDICSVDGRDPANAGKYPLPVDVLRAFLFDGTMHSNYLAKAQISVADVATAYSEAQSLLAGVSVRPTASLTLEVRADSFDAACPVLYTGASEAKSLYDADGNPFRFPTSFTLQPGAQVSVEAFTDPDWSLCSGTDPLEVISLSLVAVPTASGSDADGNLIPDDYEQMFLVGSGGSATSDLDGDGFSDLQEYLDGTDPASNGSHGATPVDFSAPTITLDASDLSIDWPASYASEFIFVVEYTEDLPGTPFATEQELPQGDLDAVLDRSAAQRFYRVKMQLR